MKKNFLTKYKFMPLKEPLVAILSQKQHYLGSFKTNLQQVSTCVLLGSSRFQ